MFVEFMYWYWIYSANNWGIYVKLNLYVSIGYILPTIEEYMLVEFIYCYWNIFCQPLGNIIRHILQPYTLQLTYIPQLLAEYSKYQ